MYIVDGTPMKVIMAHRKIIIFFLILSGFSQMCVFLSNFSLVNLVFLVYYVRVNFVSDILPDARIPKR